MITKILKEQTPKSDRLKSCSYDLAVISKDARGMQLKNESWRLLGGRVGGRVGV